MIRELAETALAYCFVFVLFVLPRLIVPLAIAAAFGAGLWIGLEF